MVIEPAVSEPVELSKYSISLKKNILQSYPIKMLKISNTKSTEDRERLPNFDTPKKRFFNLLI